MPAWESPSAWVARFQAERDRHLVDPPGNLWFQMIPPMGGPSRRVHSGLAFEKMRRGWFVQGMFTQTDDGEFPPE